MVVEMELDGQRTRSREDTSLPAGKFLSCQTLLFPYKANQLLHRLSEAAAVANSQLFIFHISSGI